MLHIAGINYESAADADGIACTIFFSGCKRKCKGCHSMDTWNFNYGEKITDDLISLINNEIDKRPFLSALVLSGGAPTYSAAEGKKFVSMIHVPKNNIWCYSGFKIERILKNPDMRELLTMCNVLVDGEFDINKRDITLSFRGSGNQRVIDVRKTLMKSKICLWNRR